MKIPTAGQCQLAYLCFVLEASHDRAGVHWPHPAVCCDCATTGQANSAVFNDLSPAVWPDCAERQEGSTTVFIGLSHLPSCMLHRGQALHDLIQGSFQVVELSFSSSISD